MLQNNMKFTYIFQAWLVYNIICTVIPVTVIFLLGSPEEIEIAWILMVFQPFIVFVFCSIITGLERIRNEYNGY
jgi:hypothetical protein